MRLSYCCCATLFLVAKLLAGGPESAVNRERVAGYHRPYKVDWETGFSEGLGEVEVNGKWGFADAQGRVIIQPSYASVRPFSAGLAPVRTGVVSEKPEAVMFGLAGFWCWIDRNGREVARGDYSLCGPFVDGLATAAVGGRGILSGPPRFGYASQDGRLLINGRYMSAYDFSDGLAMVLGDQLLHGYIDTHGNVAIDARFQWGGPFSQGRALVVERETYKIIDATGVQVAILPYERVREFRFREGMCGVMIRGKWGFVNHDGELKIPCQFEWVDPFHEGLAAVAMDGKVGFVDRQGKTVIEPKFDLTLASDPAGRPFQPDPSAFSEGLAAVRKDGKWGYVGRDGRWAVPPQYEKAGPFTEGAAKVALDNKLGYIDRNGRYIWKPTR